MSTWSRKTASKTVFLQLLYKCGSPITYSHTWIVHECSRVSTEPQPPTVLPPLQWGSSRVWWSRAPPAIIKQGLHNLLLRHHCPTGSDEAWLTVGQSVRPVKAVATEGHRLLDSQIGHNIKTTCLLALVPYVFIASALTLQETDRKPFGFVGLSILWMFDWVWVWRAMKARSKPWALCWWDMSELSQK